MHKNRKLAQRKEVAEKQLMKPSFPLITVYESRLRAHVRFCVSASQREQLAPCSAGRVLEPAVFPTASPNARVVADLQVGQLLRFVSELVFALGRSLEVQHHTADAMEVILRLAEKGRVHPVGFHPERQPRMHPIIHSAPRNRHEWAHGSHFARRLPMRIPPETSGSILARSTPRACNANEKLTHQIALFANRSVAFPVVFP